MNHLLLNFFLLALPLMTGHSELNKTSVSPVIACSEMEHCLGNGLVQKVLSRIPSGMYEQRVAVVDFTRPSEQQRFYIIDPLTGRILLQTWVAHGRNTGDRIARHFSNTPSSLMSSPGLYRVGEAFNSPKHGTALVLEGLDKGVNDNARTREIIIHGADYVSEAYIEQNGRCGRSHGCPAVPREEMHSVMELLPPGSLLYIYN